jgi:hypothetical protein
VNRSFALGLIVVTDPEKQNDPLENDPQKLGKIGSHVESMCRTWCLRRGGRGQVPQVSCRKNTHRCNHRPSWKYWHGPGSLLRWLSLTHRLVLGKIKHQSAWLLFHLQQGSSRVAACYVSRIQAKSLIHVRHLR